MWEVYFKFKKELGPWGALGALAILAGLALSTGLSLDDLKHFPPEHLSAIQTIGVCVGVAGLLFLVARFIDKTEKKEAKRITERNWKRLVNILAGHQALSIEDKPIFPNRVVNSMYLLREEINDYLKVVGDDVVATEIAINMRWLAQSFIGSVESIEYEGKIKLHSDDDIELSELRPEHQDRLIREHDRIRDMTAMFIRGIFFGHGDTSFVGFHNEVRWR